MKYFTVSTFDFVDGIQKCSKAINKKQFEMITNVKMEIENGICIMSGTDLEKRIDFRFDVVSGNENANVILYNSDNILKAVKFFKDDITSFEIEDEKIIIKCGNKKIEQRVLDGKEYPEKAELKTEIETTKYNIKDLKKRFNTMNYAVSGDNAKPIMQGIHFNENDMVSCDGYRLALNKDEFLNIENKFTIPFDSLKVACDVLENEIYFTIYSKYVIISDKQTTVTSRLFDGEFIDYKKFFTKGEKEFEVDLKEINSELKYLSTFVNSSNKEPVRLFNGDFEIKTQNGNYSTKVNVNQDTMDSPIGFNIKYFMEGLSQFNTNKVSISHGGNTQPVLITSEDDSNNMALVLPVRLTA